MVLRRQILAALTVSLLWGASAVPAVALDRVVTIVNNTKFTIVRFYGSNKGSRSWEEDILGNDVLGPFQSVRIDFDDGSGYCKFDFKAIFNDGDELVQNNVNVCEISTFTYK